MDEDIEPQIPQIAADSTLQAAPSPMLASELDRDQLKDWLENDGDGQFFVRHMTELSVPEKAEVTEQLLRNVLKLKNNLAPDLDQLKGLDTVDFVLRMFVEPVVLEDEEDREENDAITVAFNDVVVDSWRSEFFGDAFQALWRYICDNFDPELVTIYAHYIVLFQSSGTGKSRLIDELAKEIFVIPLCLRVPGTSGYPPGDKKIREYLLNRESRTTSYARSFAFMQGLFLQTAEVLNGAEFAGLSYQKTAYLFRQKMTEGMGKRKHNDFRKKFYDKVHAKAETYMNDFKTKLELRKQASEAQQAENSSKSAEQKNAAEPVSEKQEQLTSGTQASDTTSEQADQNHGAAGAQNQNPGQQKSGQTSGEQKQGPRKIDSDLLKGFYKAWTDLDNALKSRPGAHQAGPRVLLCFDEAHDLTHPVPPTDTDPLPWSPFGEFRATLRALISCSVFSIFLSTTGRFSHFTALSHDDMSARVSGHSLKLIPPYCDIGFDTLLLESDDKKLDLTGRFRLRDVVRDEFMSQFGRPLFGLMYQHGSEGVINSMRTFVTQKLLNFHRGLPAALTPQQKTACLGFRLPLEFLSTLSAQSKDLDQVESHLRICLRPSTETESLVTISPSEPLVAEAAARLMHHKTFDPIDALKDLIAELCIHPGDRGELVASLLLILARDNSIDLHNQGHSNPQGERVFSPHRLLSSLIRSSDYETNVALKQIHDDFPQAVMHFNHYIRPHQQKMIARDCLLYFMGRGAAILCAGNTPKIDIVHPFLLGVSGGTLESDAIAPMNFGVILIRVEADTPLSATMACFYEIDPYEIGVLSKGQRAVPIIRIVMALASHTSSISVVRHEPSQIYNAIRYDILISGLSSEVYRPVDEHHESKWRGALVVSRSWEAIYKVPAGMEKRKSLRQAAHPGAADDSSHWSQWTKAMPDNVDS